MHLRYFVLIPLVTYLPELPGLFQVGMGFWQISKPYLNQGGHILPIQFYQPLSPDFQTLRLPCLLTYVLDTFYILSRDIGRSENLVVLVLFGGHNWPPWFR